jgi:transcriptional regulator with XRE-family HTH domain
MTSRNKKRSAGDESAERHDAKGNALASKRVSQSTRSKAKRKPPRESSRMLDDLATRVRAAGLREVARRADVDPGFLSRLLAGSSSCTLDTLERIADAVHCDLALRQRRRVVVKG